MDLITIIINVYNGEKFIDKCLDCVMNQTYKKLEILIVNDGSTDNTLSICEKYKEKDKRIRIITTKNLKLALSRNKGIDNAKGKLLYFIDVDDYMELDTIEYLYNLHKEYDSDITECESLRVYDYNTKAKNEVEIIREMSSLDIVKELLLHVNNYSPIWKKLINRKLFDNIRFADRPVNDLTVVYKLYFEADKIVYSNQIKYYYFQNNLSLVANTNLAKIMDIYKAVLERYDYVEKLYPGLIENKVGVLMTFFNIYYRYYKFASDFYKQVNLKKTYNDYFDFRIFKCKMRFNDKIKLLLFRINPALSVFVTRLYVILNCHDYKRKVIE